MVNIAFSGMTSRDFKGIPSLQEVECKGENLKPDVKLLSLKMYRVSDNTVLASRNVFKNSCLTEDDFSSCFVDTRDTHQSKLRVLVDDLEAGESRVRMPNQHNDHIWRHLRPLLVHSRLQKAYVRDTLYFLFYFPVQCKYVFRSCQCVCVCLNSPVDFIAITLAVKKFT